MKVSVWTRVALIARSYGLDPGYAIQMSAQDFALAVAACRARRRN